MELFTTDLLSPYIWLGTKVGTLSYLSLDLVSIICSSHVLVAMNSDDYVAVSAITCFLDHHAMKFRFIKYSIPVTDHPARTS